MNAATAADAGTLKFGERTFVVRKPSEGDYMAFRKELRRQLMAESVSPMETAGRLIAEAEKKGKPLPQSMIDSMIRTAMSAETSKAMKADPSEEQIREQAMCLDAVRWWAWWLCRKSDVKLEGFAELIPDDDAAIAAYKQINALGEPVNPNS